MIILHSKRKNDSNKRKDKLTTDEEKNDQIKGKKIR